MTTSNNLDACRPVHLPSSYADNFMGEKILRYRRSPDHFTNETLPRIIAFVLPFFHLMDATRYHFQYLKAKITGKTWIVAPSDTHQGLPVRKYLEVGNAHLRMCFKSTYMCWKKPESAVLFIAKMAETELPKKAITYELWPMSRFGDNFQQYLCAKWVAYKLDLPLIMKPFPHWNELKLSENAKYFHPNSLHNLVPVQQLENKFDEKTSDFIKNAKEGIFQACFLYKANIDWSDEAFRASVQHDLEMFVGVPPRIKKGNHVEVALHYRDGGSFDSQIEKHCNPAKLPIIDYYKEQILRVLEYYKGQNVHFQIFTDAPSPDAVKGPLEDFVKERIKTEARTVSFGVNEAQKDPEVTTMRDMKAMSTYQCLIRPDSGLSKVAALIGAPELEIYPQHHFIEYGGNTVTSIIDKVAVIDRKLKNESIVDSNIRREYVGPKDQVRFIMGRNGVDPNLLK